MEVNNIKAGQYFMRYGFVYVYENKKYTRLWDGQCFTEISGLIELVAKEEAMKLAKGRF